MQNKELLLEAVNILLRAPNAKELYASLMAVGKLPQNLPIKLTGDASVLNPMLALWHEDRPKFDAILSMVDGKRSQLGLTLLAEPEPEVKFDKNEYQRALMADRRAREVPASNIENLRRPPSSQLIGARKLAFQRVQGKKWSARFKAIVDAEPKPPTKARRQELAQAFWATVDNELAESEAAVLRWIQNGRKGEAP